MVVRARGARRKAARQRRPRDATVDHPDQRPRTARGRRGSHRRDPAREMELVRADLGIAELAKIAERRFQRAIRRDSQAREADAENVAAFEQPIALGLRGGEPSVAWRIDDDLSGACREPVGIARDLARMLAHQPVDRRAADVVESVDRGGGQAQRAVGEPLDPR